MKFEIDRLVRLFTMLGDGIVIHLDLNEATIKMEVKEPISWARYEADPLTDTVTSMNR